jgi:adenylate kinase family enzyme
MGDKVDFAGVIYFEANETTMTERILGRAATSGRNDDNLETLKKRFNSFRNE